MIDLKGGRIAQEDGIQKHIPFTEPVPVPWRNQMQIRKALHLILILVLALPAWAGISTVRVPEPPLMKIERFAHAIAKAEGFYRRGTIPNRYHNCGDLKAVKGFTYPGQVGIGKGRHVIFANDAAGWNALYHQINKMISGESRHYSPQMTINQIARFYAGNWRQWARNVSHNLGVPSTTTLAEVLEES
jgi:hypothetical protein